MRERSPQGLSPVSERDVGRRFEDATPGPVETLTATFRDVGSEACSAKVTFSPLRFGVVSARRRTNPRNTDPGDERSAIALIRQPKPADQMTGRDAGVSVDRIQHGQCGLQRSGGRSRRGVT
jgi:hypothetical protein